MYNVLGRKICFMFVAVILQSQHVQCQVNLNATPVPGVQLQSHSQEREKLGGENIVGTVRVENGKVVKLVTAAKIFRIEGLIVRYLLHEDGKQWRLQGRLIDELTLEAVYAVPLQARKS